MKIILTLLMAAAASVLAQSPEAIVLPPGYFEMPGKTNLVARTETNGVTTLTFSVREVCFAAVYPPCPGHTRTWTETFTNAPVTKTK